MLVDSETIYIDVETRILAEIGLIYDPVDYQTRFTGLGGKDFAAALAADCARRGLGPFPDDFVERSRAACNARFATELRAVPGLLEFVDAHGARHAVASSSPPDALRYKLRLTGLEARFDPHIYSGAEVPRGKPAPDLFLMAAARLGVTPEHCVVVEDSANGVIAAKAAGMTAWGFTGAGHATADAAGRLAAAGADRTFASFREMAAAWAARQDQ